MARRRAAVREVRVRMYRQGLGDCFLLTFPGDDRPRHVMVDCGVFVTTDQPEKKMTAVLDDVHAATGGTLDLVIATHEHWDHLSGFTQAPAALQRLSVERLWTAWTEDPADGDAARLRGARRMRIRMVERMLERLEARGRRAAAARGAESLTDRVAGIRRAMAFDAPRLGAAGDDIAAAFRAIKTKAGAAHTRYLEPGQVVPLPGVSGAHAYVLGPPRSERALHRMESKKAGVLYLASLLAAERGLAAALDLKDPESYDTDEDRRELARPFDRHHAIPQPQAKRHPFFAGRYHGRGERWREIDDEWLGAAGELALHIGTYTNNTSLALAIELTPGGKVLLLPGDAQLGSWESWDTLDWPRPGGGARVTLDELLARTVLYKVSHHGSHNGTPKDRGLLRMTSPELAAMIPVDTAKARRLGFTMPLPTLLRGLKQRTRHRVLRADRKPEKPAALTASEWKQFTDRVAFRPRYVEYRIPME